MHDEVVIRYIGCIGVAASMRSLNPKTRSRVAKESINRLCRANNIDRNTDEKYQHDYINQMLDNEPNLSYSGRQVEIRITATHLDIIDKDTKDIIVQHEMSNVSFASSGDDEPVEFVAYVAKNFEYKRACFVLQCSSGSGESVLNEIARAFKQRTQQLKEFYNTNTSNKKSPTLSQGSFNSTVTNVFREANLSDVSLDASNRSVYDSCDKAHITETRALLECEAWFHGSYLSREESETRLKSDGDFLVRESMLDPGHFVLSVMNDGTKLHLLFDTLGQVRTKEMVFDNISQLVSYHHKQGTPIVADNRVVYLKTGVPSPRFVK